MEAGFWVESWELGGTKTSFHLNRVHPHALALAEREDLRGARVLVPLCGKTLDMLFLAGHAAEVVGVELVPRAVREFFDDNGLDVVEERPGVFRSGNVVIHCADLFELTAADLGPIDLVYDRASLIAFPEQMRRRYTAKIVELTRPGSRYFLNTLEYRPVLPEPPFAVGPDDVAGYYLDAFDIEHLHDEPKPEHRMVEKFGLDYLTEHGFLLTRR
ncbi:class I SAM-dependent methyltransferase [Saccharothrix syringae]|uniref:thiopurine S-methyltransferase n=1 Tax=Saccharothrix syringae TaxID=103733 RepID=A0A5Q0H3T1_SACSY|nr:thiopurine S-methyltransferase [Saccharothrix syringae]QFZ20896.1 thiopurine S-methyltransferase [Saccharothrix syringae]